VKGTLSDPSVSVIPVKSAAATYGTLLFAPYVFVGLKAADYLSGKVKSQESPCLAYERTRKGGEDKAMPHNVVESPNQQPVGDP